MTLDTARFTAVVETAKAKAAGNRRWLAAIEKAAAGVVSGWWVITELHDGVMVTTECGQTYHANGTCSCRAFELGQPCKHRALARLIELYNEEEARVASSPASERAALIASIKTAWSRKFPTDNLADNLMARFKKNQLEMLADDMLAGVLAATA